MVASKGSKITKPHPSQETAIFTVSGKVEVNGKTYHEGEFILLDPEDDEITMAESGRFILLGGDKFEQVPLVHWNFVSFSEDRIGQAIDDWKNGRFPTIPGDDKEFIPL